MKQNKPAQPRTKAPVRTPARKEVLSDTTFSARVYGFIEEHGLAVTMGVALLLILVIFGNFIAGNVFYLFKDIGSDSINYSFPNYISYMRYFREEGFPLWAFDQGMGQEILSTSLTDPFYWIVHFFGEANAAYGMVWMEIAKILIATFAIYRFLKILNLSNLNAMIGALLYGFSGFMIVGGSWIVFSVEACTFAVLLLGFEMAFKQNRWQLFPVAIAFVSFTRPFSLYFFGIFLIVYFLVRHFSEGDSWKRFLVNAGKLTALALLGVLMSSFLFAAGVQLMLDSPRVEGSSSYFNQLMSKSVFFLEQPIHYTSFIFRTFSNDLLGNGSDYKGWYNYLEAPMTYIGLLPLVLFPQIFFQADRRRKTVFALFFGLFLIPVIFPYFRYALWAFTGDYFRAFSLYFSLPLLLFSLESIQLTLTEKKKFSLSLLAGTLVVLLALLLFPYESTDGKTNTGQLPVIVFFLLTYAALSWYLSAARDKRPALLLIAAAVVLELAWMNFQTVNKRECLTSEEIQKRTGFNDYTLDALAFIKSADSGFYRINKDYSSGPARHRSMNDAKIQGYYGTMFYTSFNQKFFIRFLEEAGIARKGVEQESRWARGLAMRPLLQIWGSVKYNLSKSENPSFLPMGYDQIGVTGDVKILKNRHFLPLGYTYDRYLPVSEFRKLSSIQKDLSLLQSVIAEEPTDPRIAKLARLDLKDSVSNPTWQQIGGFCEARKADTFHTTLFSNNRITGRITVKEPRLLFFSIPYDRGWSATINGQPVAPLLCNLGFTGIMLEPGTSEVELRYLPVRFKTTLLLSLAGIALYLLLVAGDWWLKHRKKAATNPEAVAEREQT